MTEQTLEKNKKKIKISNLHEIGLLIALILVLLLFSFTTENFFTQRTSNKSEWRNLREILLPFFDLRSTNQTKWEKVWINASELEKERILGYFAQYIIFEADKHREK